MQKIIYYPISVGDNVTWVNLKKDSIGYETVFCLYAKFN